MTDEALNMFDSIVELVDSETSESDSTAKREKQKDDAGEGTHAEEKVVRPPRAVSRSAAKTVKAATPAQPRPELIRAHSKARVQKSIRFLPPLIAELDEHLRSLEFAGQERSIQDVMNEALDLWLDANARQK